MCYLCASAMTSDPASAFADHTTTSTTSSAPTTPVSLTQMTYQLTQGYWEGLGQEWRAFDVSKDRVVTVNLSSFSPELANLTRAALSAWGDVTALTFVETWDDAEINFTADPAGAYSTSELSGHKIVQSTVNIPPAWSAEPVSVNSFWFVTLLHEIGHALGLGHAGNYNNAAIWGVNNLGTNETWAMTVMSYFNQSRVGLTVAGPITPMYADIAAMQMLYGNAFETRAGNTRYGVDDNLTGYLGDFLDQWAGGKQATQAIWVNKPAALTIHDTSGFDTLDFSRFTMAQKIDLVELATSNVGGFIGNVTISKGTVIESAIGGSGNDMLNGNTARNVLAGSAGNDRLYGGDGDDVLIGGAGNDLLAGGNGRDTADYADAKAGVIINLSDARQNSGDARGDTFSSIEVICGSQFADTITGSSSSNILQGSGGNDMLYGLAGSDTLSGGAGADRLFGGDGIDMADYSSAAQGLVINLTSPSLQTGDAAGDLLSSIEGITASRFDDTVTGDSAANQLFGSAGNDILSGGAGNDSLTGGAGDDRFFGGLGSDRMTGNEGIDWADFSTSAAGVVINLLSAKANTGDARGDIFTDIEGFVLTAFNDSLFLQHISEQAFGGMGNDSISGLRGNDSLFGGAGNDTLIGGEGRDILNGGDGFDTASYLTAMSGVTLNLQNGTLNTGDAAGDSLVLIEAIVASNYADFILGSAFDEWIYGASGNDRLQSSAGNDWIFGELGNDTLDGGSGNDILTGGSGVDRFVFSGGVDRIKDFDTTREKLCVSASLAAGATVDQLAQRFVRGDQGISISFGGTDILFLDGVFSTTGLAQFIIIE